MQDKLDSLYNEYLNIILAEDDILAMINAHNLSSPQLIDINVPRGNYLASENRIVFVGKETNGWFNKKEREESGLTKINGQTQKYIDALKRTYFRINLGETYSSSIYSFIDICTKRLNQVKKTGVLLSELIRHDYNQTGAPYNLAIRLMFNNNYILRKEIEILKPDALVFLTGPTYDKYISLTYPEIKFLPFKNYDITMVAVLEGIPNIGKAVRIYHPDAHKYKGKEFKIEMAEIVFEFCL